MKNKTIVLFATVNILIIFFVINGIKSVQQVKLDVGKSNHLKLASGDYRGLLKVTDGFWVGNGNTLHKIDHNGTVLDSIAFDQKVMAISTVKNNSLLVATVNSVYKLNSAKREKIVSLAKKSYITDIVSDDENIYIADAGRRVLIAVNLATKKTLWEKSGFKIPSPYFAVDINPAGELWATNPGKHTLLNIDKATGEEAASWQPTEDKFVGCCNPALMLAIEQGKFITFEKGIYRLQLFTPAGTVKRHLATKKDFPINQFNFSIDYNGKTLYLLDDSQDQIRKFKFD